MSGGRLATAIQVAAWAKAGERKRHGCGNGLWFAVNGTRTSWLFRYERGGRAREMGLGAYPAVSLKQARAALAEARAVLASGLDPIDARRGVTAAAATVARAEAEAAKPAKVRTFKEAAEDFIASHERAWKSLKHAAQWTATLKTYVHGAIGAKAVGDITTDDVLAILQPIWTSRSETASRVRGRIEVILAAEAVRGNRPAGAINPATWHNHLSLLLPAKAKVAKVEHHAALPWAEVPAFMAYAEGKGPAVSWLAIRFAILTAARSGEVRGSTWGEIDLDRAVWSVPAGRMKAGREHRVPLSSGALAVLIQAKAGREVAPDDLVFPAPRSAKPLSDMALTSVLRKSPWRDASGDTITLHGTARSSFRDWCGESTNHAREVAEAALAHAIKDKAEAASARGDLMEKRRRLMSDWGAYCLGTGVADAVDLATRRAG